MKGYRKLKRNALGGFNLKSGRVYLVRGLVKDTGDEWSLSTLAIYEKKEKGCLKL